MLPTMRAETPSRPRVISVYSPFCGFSGIGDIGRTQADAVDHPVAARFRHGVVGVDGLVRLVECADAEMHDPRGGAPVMSRDPDAGRQAGGPHQPRHQRPSVGWPSAVMTPRNSASPFSRPIAG